jgi:protein-tyrosine phosphatase
MSEATFNILFVCMGNICRSPAAEAVFTKKLADKDILHKFKIDSAGTHNFLLGAPPDERTQACALKRGYDLSNLRARPVVEDDFEEFDLLLTMDWDNRALLEEMCSELHLYKIRGLAEFLQTILGALASVPQQKMVQIINRADLDVTSYRRMLRAMKAPEDGAQGGEQAKPELPQFNPGNPEKFLPNTVGNYDLSKINQAARIALAQKSAEIISKQTDMRLDSQNMIEIMKQLIDDINKNGQKQIPTV